MTASTVERDELERDDDDLELAQDLESEQDDEREREHLDMSKGNELAAMYDDLASSLAGIFEAMDWAEDEIVRAQRRHPEARDRLYHSFSIVRPTEGMPLVEAVVRSHARELLDRVAAGQDTRPGTGAEVCIALMEVSQATPMHGAACGLYMRTFAGAFPGLKPAMDPAELGHYQALHGPAMDELEADTRRTIGRHRSERHLDDESCPGRHHGEPRPGCVFHVPAPVEAPEQMELSA